MISQIKPSRKVVCAHMACGKLARWKEVSRPTIGSRQMGPYFYHTCGQHKRIACDKCGTVLPSLEALDRHDYSKHFDLGAA
jgi:hypothetical protein